MATEAVIPEPVSITEIEAENKNLTSKQHDRIVNEFSQGELEKFQGGNNQPPETAEFSAQTENMQVSSDFGVEIIRKITTSNVGTSEGESFIESPSAANHAHEETCKISKHSQADEIPFQADKKLSEDEKQMQSDGKFDIAEETGSGENEVMEGAEERAEESGMSHDILNLTGTSVQMATIEEPNFKIEEEKSLEEERILDRHVEVIANQHASVEENLKSIEKEFRDSQKVEKEMIETGETADFESGKEILDILEVTSGQNKEASIHGPDLTIDSMNKDGETVMEACKNEEGIIDTKFVEEGREETSVKEVEVKESEKNPDLVDEETGPEAIKPGETAGIEKDMKEKTLYDSIEDVSASTVAASPNIHNDAEAIIDIRESTKEELYKPPVTMATEVSSMIEAGPEFGEELKEVSDIACIEKSQDTVESSEKMENIPPVEDEMHDINKLDTSLVTETEKICLQAVDSPEIFKEVPEIKSEDIVKESPEEVKGQTEIHEKIAQTDSAASESKDYENPEEKADASFIKDEGMQSVRKGLETTDTVVAGNDNISDTEMIDAVENRQREMSKHEESPEESLLQQNEPENEKLERSLSMVSEDIHTTASSAYAETITCVTEETPIKSHEEGSEEKGMEDTQIQDDDGGENGIPKEENLPPTELSEKIGSVEAEITNTNPIDFHVTPLAEEAEQKECENLNKVSKFEHEEVHEANGASKGEEKHIEDNPEAFQCTNGAILEHTSTEGEVTTELTSKTNEMDTEKFQKLCELDSEENLKSKDAEENIEKEIQKEEDCNAETCQITTKSDDTVTTISDAETSVMVKSNVFARDETIEQNSEVEGTLEAAPAVSCEDESNKAEDNEEKSNITTDKVQDGPEITGTGEAINEQIIEGNITCMSPELVEKVTVQSSKDSEDKAEKSKGEDSGEQIIEESIAKEVLSPEVIGEGPVKNFQDDEKEGKKSEGEIFEGSETVEAGKSIAHETSQTVESPEDMLDTSMVIQEESRNLAPAEATPEEKRNEDTSSVIVGEENSTDTKIVEVKGDFEEGEGDSKQILLKNETREMFDTSLLKQEEGLQGEDKNLTPAETSPEEKRNEDRPSVMMTEETGRDAELVETAGNVEKCKEDSKQTLQKNEAGEMLDTSLVKQEEILQNEGKNLNLTEASPEEERNEDSVIRVEENGSYTEPVEAKGNVEKTEAVTPNPDKMEEGAVQKLDETLDKEGKDKETKDNDGTKDNLNAKVEDIEIVVETSDASEGTESIVLEPTTTMGKMESETSKNGYKLDSTKNLEGEDDMKNIEEEIKKETKEEYEGSEIASKVEETETHIIKEEYGDSDITPEIIGEETVKTSEGDERQMPKLEVCEELQTTSVGEDAEKQILEEKNTNEENLKSIEKEFSDSQKNEKDMTETGETADLESGKEILNILEATSGQNKEASFHGPDLTVMEAYKKEEGIVDTKFIEEEMEETCVKESEKSPGLGVEETGPEATKPGETAGIEKDMEEKTLYDSIEDVSTLTVAASPNIQNYEEATTDIKEGAKEELCKPSVTLTTDLSSMIVAGPEFDKELKEACDIACIEKSEDTIESSEKKENLPPVEDDMDDTNKSETSIVAETEKVCLQTADNPEIFKEVPEIRTESIVKESTEDVEDETEILEQIVQIGSTASEKGKDYENPEEKVDASFMKDEGMQSVGEGLDTTDASVRENTNEGESAVVVGNDNISDTEIVAAVEQCQREMSKHEESPEESLLQQNEPRNEKLERSLSMVSEEIHPAATSATAETITCVSEETPVKRHEEDFEDKRKEDTPIQNDAAGETGILEEKNLPPVELNEKTGGVEVKITNKNADVTHVFNTLVEEEAEQKEWEKLDEVSKCEPEEVHEANGSSKQEIKHIEDNSDACQSTNGAILEHASTEEAVTRSLTSKTSEMDTEKLQVIFELDSEEKSKNEEARENIEEAFQNKVETCDTDIHEIATKTLVGDEAVIRDTEASVMIESNEFAGDDTIKQNFEVESILEAAPAVSGEDESNKAEDNKERNNIITEEVHDGPKITGTGEHTNEQIIIDNITCLSPELVKEETVQSSQDKENKAEECEEEDSREHIIEKSNIEDISPEVVGEGPVKNFQDDGKEAEKSEEEIFEGSETALEESFQSEGKNLSPTEASPEEKRNEDTSSAILTEETGRDAELVETAGNVEKCEEDSKQILQKNEAGEMMDTSLEKQEEILQNEGKNLNLTEASPEEKRNEDSFIGAEENSSDAAPAEAKGNVEKGEEDLKQILQENETGEELERSLDVMSEETEAVTQNADDTEEGAVQNVEETLEKEEKDGGIKDNNGTQDKVIAKDTEIVVETSNAMESVDRIVSEPEPTTGKMESETSNKGYELDSTENLESKDSRKNIEVEIKKEPKEEYEGSEIASNGEKTEIHIIKEECGVSDITPEIIGEETVKSIKGDEDETKVEVYEELQTTSAGEDAEKQILEEKNTIEDQSTVLNGGEKIEEISEEDNKVAKMPIQEGCEIIQTDDIGKQNIEEGSIAEDKENLGDEPVEEVQDGTKITGTGEATNEQIIESNITCPSPELIEEETVQSSQDNENKVEKCEGEYSREQIIEKSNIEDLSPEVVGESPVKNFQDDGKDAEKSEGEIFEGSETAGGSESLANETSQTVESPKEMLDTSMVQQEESLDSESRNLTPTEASPEKRINEVISSVMVGEQNSSDTELVKVKENVEEGEDDLKQVLQENETGEMLETSMVKREEGFQTESKNLCPTEASPEEKINEDSSSVVMTEETGRDAKLVETAGNVEKCEEDSKQILQKNEAGAILDTSLVKQEENFQNEGKNLNLTEAAPEEKINEDSVIGAEENSSDAKPFEAKGNVEKGEEDSKQILQEYETGEELERSLDVMSEGTEAVTPNADDMVEGAVEKLEETLEKDNCGTKDNGITNVKDLESGGTESIVLEPESTMGEMESETSNKGYELDSTENLESKDSMKNIEEEIKKETKEECEGSETAGKGEETETHIIKEEYSVSDITPEIIGEEIVKSIEGDENETQMTKVKVYEELQTTSVGEDDEKQILEEKNTIEDQFTEIEPSSKEDNKVAKMPKQEVCEIIETEDIGKQNIEEGSMAEGKENLGDEPEKEVCKEYETEALSTSTEKENIEEHTKPGLPPGEETVKESSKEDESDAMQLKEEVQDCNSALIEKTEATGSVEETTSDTLTEPKKDSHAFHVIKSREEDGDVVDNSSVSEMSEKDIKEEISAKREITINDSDSTVMVETDGIIYKEAEPEDKIHVESSNLASQEMDLAVTETKEAMLDNVHISAKPENSSNLGERRDEKIPTATDEAEEKMEYGRQEEVLDAGSEGQKEQTTVETCSKDILGEDLKENPIMPSQEHQLMTTRASETTEEIPTSFQAPYENIEAPVIAQATEELLMQKEDKPTASIDDSESTSVETGKENEDEELQKHRGEDLYVHPELDTDQYISKSEDVENLKREETGVVAAQRDICESKSSNDEESSILELEKEKTEDEKPLDEASKCIETSVTCTDGEKYILEEENIADSVVDSSKEGVEVVNAAVEFEGGAHSHGHEVTKSKDDGTPTEENPVTDTLDERLKCASELVAEDQSNETLQESNKSKIEGNSNVIQDQEGEKEIKDEKEPKLEPEDLSDKEQNINETMKAVILSQEVHEGVEKADNDEIVKEHVIEEESGFNELHKVITKDETTNEVKDSSPLSTEYLKATDCKREATVEKESEEEKAKEGGSEKPVDVSSTPAEESEENFEKIIEETQSCYNKIDTATETAVTAETSLREAQLDDKPVKILDISSDETSLETAETVAVQQGNRVDCMKLEETSCDLASQILANDGEHTQKENGALENPDVIEDEEIKIACGEVYESKDRETKETDETGKSPTVEKLDADEIEEETEEASNIVPDSKSQGVEAVIEDEITDDQTLPAEKPEEQLQTPSPFEEQKLVTTTTVDREEGDKTKEAERPEDESPEDSSATKTTEGPRELEVPILGLEVNDEDIKHSSNEVHEEERGTLDEVKVDREKVSETVSKSESQGIEAVIEDEISADQTVLAEASSAALLLKEQEYGTVTTKEKTQEKTKEVEMLQDETPENSSAPKTIEETCPLTEEPRELELSQLGLELDKDMHKECPIEVQKEEGGTLDEIKEEIKEASETVWQSKSEGVEAAKIIVDQTLPLEISEEKHQTSSLELLCKEQEHGTTRTIENMEERTKEVEMLQDESPANSSATKTTEEKCYQMEESRELEVSCLGLELNKDLQKDTPNVVPEEECGILNEIKEEITETSETALESRPQGCEAVTKDGIIADERPREEKLEEKHQTPSSALLSREQEYGTITMIENVEENKKELEMPELGNLENSAAPKTTEETCLQNVEPRELEASKFGLEVSTDIQKDSPNETHVEETRILDKDVKLEPQEYKNEMKSESLSESEKETEKITELTRPFEKASSVKSETSEKAFESVSEIHGYEVLTKSEDTEIKVKHPKAVLTDLKAEDNQCEKTSEATEIIQNEVLIEQTKEENEDAKNCQSVSPGEETFKERNREFEPKAEEKVGEETFQNEELYEEIEKAGTSENIVKQIIAEEKLVVENETIKATTLSEEESGVEISQNEGTMDPAAALEVTRDIQQPEKISHAEAEPKVSIESISAGGKDVPIVETLQSSKAGDSELEYATVVDSGVKEYEHGGEKRMDDLGEIKTEESTSMDSATISLCDLMQKSRKETPQVAGHLTEEKVPMASKEEMHVEDRGTVLEKDGEEEGDEHKKTDSSPDAPVMVEASKDKNVKVAHKKSHNILSGVGSKVKHSFSKVKKAITGKSSHPKLVSPK